MTKEERQQTQEEEVQEQETPEEEGELVEEYDEEGEEEEEEKVYKSQDEVDDIVKRRLERERRKVAKELGMSMEEAREYIEAGKTVSQAAQMTPSQVRQRLIQQQQQRGQQMQGQGQHQAPTPPPVDDDIRREIRELKQTLTEKEKADFQAQEESKARKEFGKLYDEYAEDIREKAEDLDISPVDAAAMVLRPKLKDHYENQTKKKQQTKKRRKVEGSSESPKKENDPESKLSEKQKETARKMRIPFSKYAERLQEIGELE